MYENVKTVESGGAVTFIKGFLKGAVIAAVITLLVFAVFAFLLSYTPLTEEAIRYIVYITEGVGAFVAGFIPAKKSGRKGILTGFLAGALYVLIIRLAAVLVSGGAFVNVHTLIMLLLSAVSGAVGGIAGVNSKTPETNKKKR